MLLRRAIFAYVAGAVAGPLLEVWVEGVPGISDATRLSALSRARRLNPNFAIPGGGSDEAGSAATDAEKPQAGRRRVRWVRTTNICMRKRLTRAARLLPNDLPAEPLALREGQPLLSG